MKLTDWPTVEGFGEEVKVVVVDSWTTTWVKGVDVEVVNVVSPLKTATTLWLAADAYVSEQVATPAVTVLAPQPVIVVPLSEKATVPPLGVGVTVAVKVTLWPTIEGFGEDTTWVLVAVVFTVWLTVPLLAALLVSPL